MVFITSTNGHGGVHGAEQVGAQIDHRAHQQAAGAAAFDHQAVLRSPLLLDQEFGAVDEVEEGIFLLHEHAVFAPFFAHFVAAANVGDGVGHAAIEQAQALAGKRGRRADAVGAVAVEEQRRLAVAHEALLVDDGDRHFDAIARGGPEALAGVLLRVVSAEHFLLFQQGGFAARRIVIEDAGGRDQALVVVAVGGGLVIRRAAGEDGVDGLGEGDGGPGSGLEIVHAQVVEGLRFFDGDREVLEQIDVVDADVVAVRRGRPSSSCGADVVFRRGHDGEIVAALVGADIEQRLRGGRRNTGASFRAAGRRRSCPAGGRRAGSGLRWCPWTRFREPDTCWSRVLPTSIS